MRRLICYLFFAFEACTVLGQGTILWNESVNGPFGNSPGTATSLGFLNAGTNSIFGMSETQPIGSSWAVYADYFTFNVPPSAQIQEILFTADHRTWIWLGDPTFGTQFGFLSNPTNGTLLPQFGLANISPGNYGMYTVNNDLQTFPTIANYRLDFVVTAVPEPSTWALLALGSVALWSAARRRK